MQGNSVWGYSHQDWTSSYCCRGGRRCVGIQSDMSNGDWLEHITRFASWLLRTVHVMSGRWLVRGWGGELDIHVISAWSGHANLISACEEVVNRELSSFRPIQCEIHTRNDSTSLLSRDIQINLLQLVKNEISRSKNFTLVTRIQNESSILKDIKIWFNFYMFWPVAGVTISNQGWPMVIFNVLKLSFYFKLVKHLKI